MARGGVENCRSRGMVLRIAHPARRGVTCKRARSSRFWGATGRDARPRLRGDHGFGRGTQRPVQIDGMETTRLAPHRIDRLVSVIVSEERGYLCVTVDRGESVAASRGSRGPRQCSSKTIYAIFPHLRERAASPGTRLSGGEQQMLAVARSCAPAHGCCCLDEISEGLAPVIVQKLGDVIRALRRRVFTVVLVEQNFRFAAPLADRFYVMEGGRIVKQFEQSELAAQMGLASTNIWAFEQ